MPLEYADKDMAPDLMKIWMEAFPEDSAEDVELFFSYALKYKSCAVWVEDGHAVSMTFLLPAVLELKSAGSLNMRYIYAASTLTKYRGRGIFGRLLKEVHELLGNDGVDACFLRPAQPGLFDYYARFGYKQFFYIIKEKIFHDEFVLPNKTVITNNSGRLSSVKTDGKAADRNLMLSGHPAWVRWSDEMVSYAAVNASRSGGMVLNVSGGWAVCEPINDKLFIREWLCCPESEAELRCAVAENYPVSEILRRRPVYPDDKMPNEPFGMIYPLTNIAAQKIKFIKNAVPYMGLAFD